MAINFIGGILFDKLSTLSPFLMVGALNFIILAYGLIQLRRRPAPA
jgi:hypothetical protein